MDRHHNVVQLRPQRTSDWLEALARRPFAPHREILLDLAERFRAIEAIEDNDDQLEIGEAA
jgi:hypothetical protein